jgi:hypothetical protein
MFVYSVTATVTRSIEQCVFTQKESESESESELLCDWRFTANQFVFGAKSLEIYDQHFYFQLNTWGRQLLVVLASAFPRQS